MCRCSLFRIEEAVKELVRQMEYLYESVEKLVSSVRCNEFTVMKDILPFVLVHFPPSKSLYELNFALATVIRCLASREAYHHVNSFLDIGPSGEIRSHQRLDGKNKDDDLAASPLYTLVCLVDTNHYS